jgi:phage tail protein X
MKKMDSSVRIAAASGVLLGGILVALIFRHDSPQGQTAVGRSGDRLILRKWPEPPDIGAAAEPPGHNATILMPTDPGQPRPVLSGGHVAADGQDRSAWGASIGLPSSTHRDLPPRTHKIVDGDTLESLADRYLGSADRSLEIYEANRDVLPTSKLLPIGVELKIPPSEGRPRPSTVVPRRPLAPIPRPLPGED